MSTVVVVRKHGVAAIAADTCTTFGDLRMVAGYEAQPSKLLRHGEVWFALTGSPVHQLALESAFARKARAYRFTDRATIFESLRKLHAVMKEEYFLQPREEDDDPFESSRLETLIASPQGIFGVLALREVNEYTRFWAMGSGGDFALGAMHACYERLENAEEIATAGVLAGAEFDTGSALPLEVRTVALVEG